MLGRDKLDNTLLTCDQGNFNQITVRSRNRTLVTVVRDTCTTTVPPNIHWNKFVFSLLVHIFQNETEEEREIKQFHFTVWPDHGVPEYPTAILAFQRRVRAYSTRDCGPLVVHCRLVEV